MTSTMAGADRRAPPSFQPPARLSHSDGVERLAGLVLHVGQQVAEQDAAGGEGERDRHVEHGALAGLGPRLAQDVGAVAHRLDPVKVPPPSEYALQEHQHHAPISRARRPPSGCGLTVSATSGPKSPCSRRRSRTRSAPTWLTMKPTKIGTSTATDSLTPRMFSAVSRAPPPSSAGSLQGCHSGGRNEKIASHPEADRDRDREDVVDDQRGARDRRREWGRAAWSRPGSRRRPLGNSSMIWLYEAEIRNTVPTIATDEIEREVAVVAELRDTLLRDRRRRTKGRPSPVPPRRRRRSGPGGGGCAGRVGSWGPQQDAAQSLEHGAESRFECTEKQARVPYPNTRQP